MRPISRVSVRVLLVAFTASAAVLLLAAAPAVADHAYSHRYLVSGRVIDALGDPVEGITVAVSLQGMESEGACPSSPTRNPTDGWGDYWFCYHVHSFGPGAQVTIAASGQTYARAADVNLRKTVQNVALTVPEPASSKNASVLSQFRTTYTLRGRVWQPQVGAVLEGIRVEGIALANVAVHATMSSDAGPGVGHLSTDAYGDYSTRFTVGSRITSGTVSAASGDTNATAAINTGFMVTDLNVVVQPPNPIVGALQAGWPLLVGVGVVAAAAFVVYRYAPRRSRARDVSRIPGIGRSKAAELREAGFQTVDRLAAASPKEVAQRTSLSPKEAKRLVRKAKEMLESREPSAAEGSD